MPATTEILDQIQQMATEGFALAVLWHLAIAIVIAALWAGWRPGGRASAALVAAPLASAATVAALYRNPFNGAVLGSAVALLILASGDDGWIRRGARSRGARLLAFALAAFAWLYPHFLDDRSTAAYLIGAPVGVVPCPSVALAVAGWLALPRGSRAQGIALSVLGGFYGLFGVLRLGVWMDVMLVAGAIGIGLELHHDHRDASPGAQGGSR